ncbi:MAG: hypothetical protein AB7U07_01190 [Thermoleophilia bacterium]
MSNSYIAGASHTAAGVVTEIATQTTLATMLQVATPSTTQILILGWGVSFKGVAAADPPGMVYLLDCDVGMTGATSLTPDAFGNPNAPASLCVGGTGATAVHDGTVTEGTITASRLLDSQEVHPQTGYGVWFPPDARPRVAVSRFLRVRVSFSVSVSCLPWVVWTE